MYNQNKEEFHRRLAVLGGTSGLGGKINAEGSSSSMDVEITTGIPLVESTVVDLACAPSIPTPATKKEAAALKKKEKAAEKAAEKASKKKGTTKATASATASVNCVSTLTNSSKEDKEESISETLAMVCGHHFCQGCWSGVIEESVDAGAACLSRVCPAIGIIYVYI